MLFYVISYVHKNLFLKPYALLLADYALRNCIRMAFGYVSNLEVKQRGRERGFELKTVSPGSWLFLDFIIEANQN